MTQYILKRLLLALFVMLSVVTLVFFSLHLSPGSPIDMLIPPDAGGSANTDLVAQLNARYGFDQPLYVQYFRYMQEVLRGDLGHSIRSDEPVLKAVLEAYPATMQLALVSLLISAVVGIGAGLLAAVNFNRPVDHANMVLSLLSISIPNYLLGTLLMLVFSLQLNWLPPAGRGDGSLPDLFRHLILPTLTLGVSGAAIIARLMRSSLLDVLGEDYIRTARSKGLSFHRVVRKHALRNAMIPVITVLGLEMGNLLAGAIIAETIFAWPGLGRLLYVGITGKDFPIVQGAVMLIAVSFVLINLLVDLLYTVLDPRVKYL